MHVSRVTRGGLTEGLPCSHTDWEGSGRGGGGCRSRQPCTSPGVRGSLLSVSPAPKATPRNQGPDPESISSSEKLVRADSGPYMVGWAPGSGPELREVGGSRRGGCPGSGRPRGAVCGGAGWPHNSRAPRAGLTGDPRSLRSQDPARQAADSPQPGPTAGWDRPKGGAVGRVTLGYPRPTSPPPAHEPPPRASLGLPRQLSRHAPLPRQGSR